MSFWAAFFKKETGHPAPASLDLIGFTFVTFGVTDELSVFFPTNGSAHLRLIPLGFSAVAAAGMCAVSESGDLACL